MNESELLLRQLDGRLDDLRTDGDPELALAEHLAAGLRQLVSATASASAAERARVRAAVHYFTRPSASGRRPRGPHAITEDVRVVNAILRPMTIS